jgi:hypothetical protein
MSQVSWRQRLTIAIDWASPPVRIRLSSLFGNYALVLSRCPDRTRSLTSHNDLLIYYIPDHGGNPGLTVLANSWPGLLPAEFFKEV